MTYINMALTRVWLGVSNLKERFSEERGQDLLEYALFGGLIAAAIVGLGVIFNPYINDMATNIGHCIDFDSGTTCSPGF